MINYLTKFILVMSVCTSVTLHAQLYNQLGKGAKLSGQHSYVLPKATILIEVQTTKIDYVPGPNFKKLIEDPAVVAASEEFISAAKLKYGVDPKIYARLKAGNGSVTVSDVVFSEDSLKVSTLATPDYSKIFYVDPEAKWNKNQSVIFSYGNDGMLTEGESVIEDKTFDIVVKSLSGVVSIIGSFFKGEVHAVAPTDFELMQIEMNEALGKFKSLDGQYNYDVYKDLKKTYEQKYTIIFSKYFYSVKKTTTITKMWFTPVAAEAKEKSMAIFEMNKKGKIIVNRELEKEIWGHKLEYGKMGRYAYRLDFKPHADQFFTFNEPHPDKAKGLAFNVPAKMEIIISDTSETALFNEYFKIPQFGIVGFLNTRKEKISFSLDPLTGEPKKLSIEGTAVLTDQVGNTSALATDVSKVIKGDDEVTRSTKEVTLLENAVKKKEALKKLEEQP